MSATHSCNWSKTLALLFLAVQLTLVSSDVASPEAFSESIADIFHSLNWNRVVVILASRDSNLIWTAIAHRSSQLGIFMSTRNTSSLAEVRSRENIAYFTTNFDCSQKDFLDLLLLDRPQYRLLLLTRTELIQKQVKQCFIDFNANRAFFAFGGASSGLLRIQTFKNQSVVSADHWTHSEPSHRLEETYNLMGAKLSLLALDWKPWVEVLACNEQEKACKCQGVVVEVFDLLADLYNFTYFVDREPNGKWGVIPVEGGWYDDNATFTGVMGSAINGEYDIPFSLWIHSHERSKWLDYTMSSPIDVTLFLRPFRSSTWFLIILMVITVALSLFYLSATWRRLGRAGGGKTIPYEEMASWRTVVISGWVFFILFNAFYGGALTMFFSSSPTLLFETVRQGLRLYPDWKMMTVAGEELIVQAQAELGDEDYAQYWDMVLDGEEGLHQPTYFTALDQLKQPGWFLYASRYSVLTDFAKYDDRHQVSLFEVGREFISTGSIICAKHSPLIRMFDHGIQRLRQTGTLDVIVKKWTPVLPKPDSVATQVLKLNQVFLGFALYGIAGFLCVVLLCGECVVGWAARRVAEFRAAKRRHSYVNQKRPSWWLKQLSSQNSKKIHAQPVILVRSQQ